MRRLILFLLFFVMIGAVHAQFTYGTTGLLNMPTADMQRDKTFMFGGGFLEKHGHSRPLDLQYFQLLS